MPQAILVKNQTAKEQGLEKGGKRAGVLRFTEIWELVIQFSSVQLLSRVRLFATPWIAARRASLSITISRTHHFLSRDSWRTLGSFQRRKYYMPRKEPLSPFSFLLCRLDYSTFSRANYPQLSCYILGLNQNITTFDYIVFHQKCIRRSNRLKIYFGNSVYS